MSGSSDLGIWFICLSPNQKVGIELVQKNFLLFSLRCFNWVSCFNLPPYTGRLLLIILPTLNSRRLMLGVMFMIKLVTGEIDPHIY